MTERVTDSSITGGLTSNVHDGAAGALPPRRIALATTLVLAMWFSVFPQSAIGILAPYITRDLGLSSTQLGALTTVVYAAGTLCALVLSRIAVRIPTRNLLAALFGIALVGMALMATSETFLVVLLAVLVGGLAGGLGNTSTNTLIIDAGHGRSNGTLVGVKQAGVQAGTFLNGLGLPLLAASFTWRMAIAMWAVLPSVGLFLMARVVPRSAAGRPSGTRALACTDTPGSAATAGLPLTAYLAYAYLMGGSGSFVVTYLPLYGHVELGMSAVESGRVMGLVGLCAMTVRVAYGRLADRRDVTPAVALTLCAFGSAASILMFRTAHADMQWLVWCAAVIYAASGGSWHIWVQFSLIRGGALARSKRDTSLVQVAFFGGLMSTPLVFGYLVDRSGGYSTPWIAVMLLELAAGCLALATATRLRTRGRLAT